jgi:hypothetical protein
VTIQIIDAWSDKLTPGIKKLKFDSPEGRAEECPKKYESNCRVEM